MMKIVNPSNVKNCVISQRLHVDYFPAYKIDGPLPGTLNAPQVLNYTGELTVSQPIIDDTIEFEVEVNNKRIKFIASLNPLGTVEYGTINEYIYSFHSMGRPEFLDGALEIVE